MRSSSQQPTIFFFGFSFRLIIAFQSNLMSVSFFHPIARHNGEYAHACQAPKHCAHDAKIQADTVEISSQGRTNSPRGGRRTLSDAVDGPQNRRVRRTVVNEDCRSWARECASDNKEEEKGCDTCPDFEPGFLAWWRRGRWDEGEQWRGKIDEREAVEKDSPRTDRAKTCVDEGVEEKLHCDPDGAENSHREANGWRR